MNTTTTTTYVKPIKKKTFKAKVQQALYMHKWILLIFYFGCIIGLGLYAIKFIVFLYEFILGFPDDPSIKHHGFLELSENDTMLAILKIIDLTMVANLMKMIITGSYQSFVDKIPENTEKVSSGLLKVKMSTSIVGITTIHLLQTFIGTPNSITNPDFLIKLVIHIVFILGSIVLSYIDTLHSKSELYEAQAQQIEEEIEEKRHKLIHERKQHKYERRKPGIPATNGIQH